MIEKYDITRLFKESKTPDYSIDLRATHKVRSEYLALLSKEILVPRKDFNETYKLIRNSAKIEQFNSVAFCGSSELNGLPYVEIKENHSDIINDNLGESVECVYDARRFTGDRFSRYDENREKPKKINLLLSSVEALGIPNINLFESVFLEIPELSGFIKFSNSPHRSVESLSEDFMKRSLVAFKHLSENMELTAPSDKNSEISGFVAKILYNSKLDVFPTKNRSFIGIRKLTDSQIEKIQKNISLIKCDLDKESREVYYSFHRLDELGFNPHHSPTLAAIIYFSLSSDANIQPLLMHLHSLAKKDQI